MLCSLAQFVTLADTTEFVLSVRDELLHGGTSRGAVALIAAFGAIAGLIVLLSRMFRSPDAIAPPPRSDLMREAAECLKLTAGERRDLALLAHRCGHTQPAAILLSPSNLSYAVSVATSAQPDSRLAAHINALCVKLHGVPLPGHRT